MIGERITQRQRQLGLRTSTLLERLGVNASTLSRWKRNINEPDNAMLYQLAVALETSTAYLVGDTDDPNGRDATACTRNTYERNRLDIPLVAPEIALSAGVGNEYADMPGLQTVGTFTVFDGELAALYRPSALTAMRVEGDSMEPQIHNGDTVIFDHDTLVVSGRIYAVCLEGAMLVKGVISQGHGRPPILRSLNRAYADIVVTPYQRLLVYGRVIRIYPAPRKPNPVF